MNHSWHENVLVKHNSFSSTLGEIQSVSKHISKIIFFLFLVCSNNILKYFRSFETPLMQCFFFMRDIHQLIPVRAASSHHTSLNRHGSMLGFSMQEELFNLQTKLFKPFFTEEEPLLEFRYLLIIKWTKQLALWGTAVKITFANLNSTQNWRAFYEYLPSLNV